MSFTLIVQGPVYSSLGLSGKFYENIGIPLQQIARTIVYEGDELTQEEDYFYGLLPEEEWKNSYRPLVVDPIKWNGRFNDSLINKHTLRFFKNYTLLGIKHPVTYFEAALMNTCGYWDPFAATNDNICCYQSDFWPTYQGNNPKQIDLLEKTIGISLRDQLTVPFHPSSALFVWAMLFSVAVCLAVGKKQTALGMIPFALLFLSLLVATPLAFSLRYAFALVIGLPLFVIAPFIEAEERISSAECCSRSASSNLP